MAMYALRLRRALSLSSCIINHHKPLCSSVPALPAPPQLSISSSQNPKLDRLNFPFQSRAFRASDVSLSSRPRTSYRDNNDDNKISPDEILFEGCDYNHWLITIDFPKDPKPSPEEMVETYVQTAAKVLGSVEEVKKKIYACSTTTYNGFQVEVSEEMSEKFKGLPGVVFVLPDSYIDPVNKEYGGDKYINGTIIPRPPPISFARSSGRYGDRNRDFNRPRGSYQQGNSTFNNQGSMQGNARNFGPPQNPPQQNYGPPGAGPPQQNYGPPGVGERRDPMPMSNSPAGLQGDRRDPLPPPQQNYGPPRVGPPQQNYGPPRVGPPQQNYGPPRVGERRDPMPMNNSPAGLENYQGDRRDPLPPPQHNYGPRVVGPPQQNYGPPRVGERRDPMPMSNSPAGLENYQADRKDPLPSYQGNYSQGHRGNSYPQGQRGFPPVEQQTNYVPPEQKDFGVGNKNYASPQGGGFGQRAGGNFGQGTGGNFGQGTGGNYGQGEGRNYGQGVGGSFGQGAGGNFGQEAGGNFGQSAGWNNGQVVGGGFGQGLGGVPGEETVSNYRQRYSGHGENQRFQEEESINMQQDQQRNFVATGQ